MPYELFDNKAAKFASPELTIRNGKVALNPGAAGVFAKAGMKFAHILWDVAACKIAIQPVTKEDGNTFKVTIPRGRRGGTIAALSFLNYIQWRATQPVTVDAQWNGTERIIEATLPREHVGMSGKEPDTGRHGKSRPGTKVT
jgi:hypothetical protein